MRRVWAIVVVALATVAAACTSAAQPAAQEPAATTSTGVPEDASGEDGLLTGFAMSPRSYTAEDFPPFLDRMEGTAEILMHAGDWGELDDPASPFHLVSTMAAQRDMAAMVVLSPSSADELIRPIDQATQTRYADSLRAFLGEHQPAYLGLANEVNMLARNDPEGFAAVVKLWEETLPIVRELAPDTQVFVTFQFERTIGRHDGWFGGSIVEADWSPIDAFADMDVLAFTSYPSLVFDDPAELGDEYYAQIAEHSPLPAVFTELGWASDENLPILPGSEEEQAAYLDVLDSQLEAAKVEAAVWTFVHGDLVTHPPFVSMDLYRPDDTPRPAWDRFLELGD